MFKDNVDLPKEANKAKCFAIACFIFSIFSMIGFAGGIPGVIGALGGILACVASSILMCCPPKTVADGGGKFMASGVILLLAGVMQIIMAIVVLIAMIAALNEVAKGHCEERYVSCTADSNGNSCVYYGTDSMCYKAKSSDYGYDASRETSCASKESYESCKQIYGTGQDVVSGIIVFFFGISAAFLIIAGLLNTIGGGYCMKAKAAMAAKAISPN